MSKQLQTSSNQKIADTLSLYKYNALKPNQQIDNLFIYDAELKQNPSLKFTIKIIKRTDNDTYQYLKALKSASNNSSQFIIKISQLVYDQQKQQIALVQEAVSYGTFKSALRKCRRLDDDDSLTVVKILLNGHIELVRQGTYWYGDQNDIQITQNGIKLSWNNTFPFSHNNQNPFPALLTRIGQRKESNSILPFPKNKMIQDLIKVSKQNASQMSLHPLLKKRQKVYKKKGKNWIALKESNLKGQYQQEISYLAISKQHGFVRVKVFQKGQISPQIMKIYHTVPSFIKIFDYYQEENKLIIVSQYSNDGTVFNYVKRLKTNSIQLKQSQIQFFFFSLIQPLKAIHKSPVQSFNMLHIKNIYIQDGIVKIGQPQPVNQQLKQTLIQRADIPDFYHHTFKSNPNSKDQKYDTYSLGVLIYKLMYTEYPIFPQGKVHVPTAPSFKVKLKNILELFLNVGGSLQQLEQNIQISQQVKLQVKNNQKALQQFNSPLARKQQQFQFHINHGNNDMVSQLSMRNQDQANQKQNKAKTKGYIWKFYQWITKRGIDRERKYEYLEKSNFAIYRQCTLTLIVLCLYFFGFFIIYMGGLYNLLSHTRLFTKADVNIQGQVHKVIVPNYDTFLNTYQSFSSKTLSTLQDQMQCKLDNKNIYYQFVRPGSPHWYMYLFLSLVLMFLILIFKGIQLCKYSTTTVGYHYYNTTMDGSNCSRFALSSYIFFQLWFGMALWAFYYLFNIIYTEQHSPCFGGKEWTLLTQTLMTDRYEFTANYFIILMVVFLFGLLSFLQIAVFFNKINYDKLCNPIFIFIPFYFLLFLTLRFGVFNKFEPSWINDKQGLIGNNYMNTIGYFPQFLIIFEIIISLLIDLVFHKYFDKKISHWILDQGTFMLSSTNVVQNNQKQLVQ